MDNFQKGLSQYPILIKAILAFLIFASLLLFAQFIGEVKSWKFVGQGLEFRNTITVSGEGKAIAVPDTAEFSFAVIKESRDVAQAQDSVTETTNKLLKALKEAGIEERDIKTTSYNIVPLYEYKYTEEFPPIVSPGSRTLIGYEASHWISVKIRETKKSGEMLALAGNHGATNISGLSFTIDDEEGLRMEARRKAIADAESKSKILAKDLGVQIVKIVYFQESGRPVYYRDFALAKEGIGGDVISSPEIPTGENTITSSVTITYAID